MKEAINQRIKKILEGKSISITQLSKEISIAQTTLNRQLNGEGQLPATTIELILAYFQDISAEWLITGSGAMLKSEQIPSINERLKYFIESIGISEMQFCESIDLHFAYYAEAKGLIPERNLKKLISTYPQLSIEWLMTGEGSMLKTKTIPLESEGKENELASLKSENESLKVENTRLRDENIFLKGQNQVLERIAGLKEETIKKNVG